jgi:Bacteriophage Lambda NinG protein
MNTKPPKPKPCKVCKTKFSPARPFQTWCSPECGLELVKAKQAKEGKAKAKAERQADRAKRERLKSRSEWAREAQTAFNAYIRARDADKPCISCGRHHDGQWHAGHYLSRGARPELAMHEDNCHKQCAPCNTHLSGNLVLYRVNLIAKIGLERVEWLEGPHHPRKLTIPDLIAIRDEYRAKVKAIESASR